jgi:hypothetical protein
VDTAEGKYSMKSPHLFLKGDPMGHEAHNVRFHGLSLRLCLLLAATNTPHNLQNAKHIGLQIASFPEKRNSVWVDAETKH